AVAIHPHDAGAGEALGERLLDALGAAAERPQVDVAASRAGARNRRLGAAVVAAKAPVGGVHDKPHGAALAAGRPTAGLAREDGRVAAAIEEEQALLAALQPRRDGLQESPRK